MIQARWSLLFLLALATTAASAADIVINVRSRVEAFKGQPRVARRGARASASLGYNGGHHLRHVGQALVQRSYSVS